MPQPDIEAAVSSISNDRDLPTALRNLFAWTSGADTWIGFIDDGDGEFTPCMSFDGELTFQECLIAERAYRFGQGAGRVLRKSKPAE